MTSSYKLYLIYIIRYRRESGHPFCAVVLFAPTFHLLPDNSEDRETQILFHLQCLKDSVD